MQLEKPCALVTRFIRTLRGGSQPILAEASNGNIYVVKFGNNVQGERLPFNESMGTELYSSCGLRVPAWEVLQLTDSFIDCHPSCWFEGPSGRIRPSSGLCYGSRYLGGETTCLLEILPGAYFSRVRNRADFWLAWALDVSADHCDRRQALFRVESSRELEAVFVDFGHMFGGATGSKASLPFRTSRYADERIYPPLPRSLLVTIKRILCNLDAEALWCKLTSIPDEWKTTSSIQKFTDCLDRLSSASYIASTLEAMVKSQEMRTYDPYVPCGEKGSAAAILHTRVPCDRRRVRSVVL